MVQDSVAHEVFDSVEDMVSPDALGRLLGATPGPVTVTPVESNGFSSNEISSVTMGEQRLVLKRLARDDWMARASRDHGCRSLAVWRTGLLDRLEPDLRHGVVAGSSDGSLDDPAYELADLETALTAHWPRSWPLLEGHPEPLALLQRGWQALLEMVAPDVRATIEHLLADPGPLLRALGSEPATLLHGDYRQDNVAVMPDGAVVALDWQVATRGPGVMDLTWQALSWEAIAVRDLVVDRYRQHLSRALGDEFEPERWERAVAIALLAEVLRKGNWTGLFAAQGMDDFREFFPVYDEAVRRGADLL